MAHQAQITACRTPFKKKKILLGGAALVGRHPGNYYQLPSERHSHPLGANQTLSSEQSPICSPGFYDLTLHEETDSFPLH